MSPLQGHVTGNRVPTAFLQLPLILERDQPQSLTGQLAELLRTAILESKLGAGTQLPSTRTLARDLGISRTVTTEAFNRLIDEGYLVARQGSGTYVAALSQDFVRSAPSIRKPAEADKRGVGAGWSFRTGRTDPETRTPTGWQAAWREVARTPPPNSYLIGRDDTDLRIAISEYLKRSRGILYEPDDLVVTTGTGQSVDLVLRCLLPQGGSIACEDPGDPDLRDVLVEVHRLDVLRIPVDVDGMLVDRLPSGSHAPRLVHVTPSHQFPLGTRMTVGRRTELVSWAREHGAVIVEDDYDSEFRFDGPPLPTLASLDSERVVYLGTLSKVLSPALRMGYIAAPPAIAARLARLKLFVDGPLSWPLQKALCELLSSGNLERHIRRNRKRYARKRYLLRAALEPVTNAVKMTGIEAGLHVVLQPVEQGITSHVVERAQRAGLEIFPLAHYCHGGQTLDGLVIGYGGLSDDDVTRAGALLAEIIMSVAQT